MASEFSIRGDYLRGPDYGLSRAYLEPDAWPWCCALVYGFGKRRPCSRSAHGFLELHSEFGDELLLPLCWQHGQRHDGFQRFSFRVVA